MVHCEVGLACPGRGGQADSEGAGLCRQPRAQKKPYVLKGLAGRDKSTSLSLNGCGGSGHSGRHSSRGLFPQPPDLTKQLASGGCVVKPKLLALVGRETEHRTLKRNTKGAVSLLYPDKSHSIRTGMISKLRYTQIHRYLRSTLRTTSWNLLFFPQFLNSERKKKLKAISPLFVLRYSHCEVSEEAVTKSSYVSP